MAIAIGDRIPSVTLMQMGSDGLSTITSSELLGGKRVALFGLPGAFTPVCSAKHLPGFVEKADALSGKGIDSIVCLSVNDPFVMDAWGKAQGVDDKVELVADPKAEFTKALGLAIDLSDFGLGDRAQRFSMIVEDGVVTALNVEESIFDCGVSAADHLLAEA